MSAARTRTRNTNHARALLAFLALAIGAAGSIPAQPNSASTAEPAVQDEPLRNTAEWNLPKKVKLAISGYDPVAYFAEGGGEAVKGKKSVEHTQGGVTYRFVSEANRERFSANPTRYEPAHGGWCSYAMAGGGKTAPDPRNFIVKDDRLFLFYKGIGGDTKKLWQKDDHALQAADADSAWKGISGEAPRTSPALRD